MEIHAVLEQFYIYDRMEVDADNTIPGLQRQKIGGIRRKQKDGSVKEALLKGAGSDKEALPVVSIIDGFGNITFLTSGYIIGTGERLLRDFRE